MEEKKNIADMLREAVKKAFNEGDTDQTKMVVLPAQQVIDICCENDKLKERNYWLQSEHEYQCEKSYFEGVAKGEEKAAKELFTELLKGENVSEEVVKDYYGEEYLLSLVTVDKIKEIAKERYGVEVE